MSETLTGKKLELRNRFKETHGYWSKCWNDLLEVDDEFFETLLDCYSVPRERRALEPKVKDFIYIAVNAVTTNLYEPALRVHVQNAFKHGAKFEELLEIFQMISLLGVHTFTTGLPTFVDIYGKEKIDWKLDARKINLKEEYIKQKGNWNEYWDGLLAIDPEFFEKYLGMASLPDKREYVDVKTKELIYIAVDINATHLYEPGLKTHIKNALRVGATIDEILETYQIAFSIGMHTFITGMPILMEEFEKAVSNRKDCNLLEEKSNQVNEV